MGTIPPDECSCRVLVEPIIGSGALANLDHVCATTMVDNLRAAMRDGIIAESRWWPVKVSDAGALSTAPRELWFIIRQWAEEEPNPTFANLLARSPQWRHLTYELHHSDWSRDRLADDAALAAELGRRQLPMNPSVVRYCRAVAAGKNDLHPARGLLVTTRVFGFPPHRVEVSGDLDVATGPLFDLARRTAISHRDWLAEQWPYLLADLSEKRKAQPGSYRNGQSVLELDYLAEAIATAEDVRLRPEWRSDGKSHAVSAHLKAVYRRVARRRERAGLPILPPKGWTQEARQRLLSSL